MSLRIEVGKYLRGTAPLNQSLEEIQRRHYVGASSPKHPNAEIPHRALISARVSGSPLPISQRVLHDGYVTRSSDFVGYMRKVLRERE